MLSRRDHVSPWTFQPSFNSKLVTKCILCRNQKKVLVFLLFLFVCLFHTKFLLVVTAVYPICIQKLNQWLWLTHLVTFSTPNACFIISWNMYSKFTTWLNVKWSRKRVKGVSNSTGFLGERNIGMKDAFKSCYQLHEVSLVPLAVAGS